MIPCCIVTKVYLAWAGVVLASEATHPCYCDLVHARPQVKLRGGRGGRKFFSSFKKKYSSFVYFLLGIKSSLVIALFFPILRAHNSFFSQKEILAQLNKNTCRLAKQEILFLSSRIVENSFNKLNGELCIQFTFKVGMW